MKQRRQFLSILTASAAAASRVQAAQPTRQTRPPSVIPLPPPFDKQTATIVELHIEPGKHSMAHKHPGFVLGYVIEGEFRFQISGGPERVLRAGDTFYEPPGVTHLVSESASPDRPARVLAIVIAEAGKKTVEPA